jgi:hypothetical protein
VFYKDRHTPKSIITFKREKKEKRKKVRKKKEKKE